MNADRNERIMSCLLRGWTAEQVGYVFHLTGPRVIQIAWRTARRLTKQKAIEYKGGKCFICGYDKNCQGAYDFHHIKPEEKEFSIGSDGLTRSWDKVKKELDKCVILCANCHREIENNFILLEDFI